jgi:FkbM family methyltransferase
MEMKKVAHREELVDGEGETYAVQIDALGRKWSWDPLDDCCWPVVFDWSSDIDKMIEIFPMRPYRSCVQAGGNFGVWPWLLSKYYNTVYTFEPDPRCFPHLVANCKDRTNIVYCQGALDEDRRRIQMMHLPGEESNLGAQFISSGVGSFVPTYRIDDLGLDYCDLIYLDIEGAEMTALRSGIETITRCRPAIVVEDKGLSEKFGYKKGDIAKWLSDFDYQEAGMLHRDVILLPT